MYWRASYAMTISRLFAPDLSPSERTLPGATGGKVDQLVPVQRPVLCLRSPTSFFRTRAVREHLLSPSFSPRSQPEPPLHLPVPGDHNGTRDQLQRTNSLAALVSVVPVPPSGIHVKERRDRAVAPAAKGQQRSTQGSDEELRLPRSLRRSSLTLSLPSLAFVSTREHQGLEKSGKTAEESHSRADTLHASATTRPSLALPLKSLLLDLTLRRQLRSSRDLSPKPKRREAAFKLAGCGNQFCCSFSHH